MQIAIFVSSVFLELMIVSFASSASYAGDYVLPSGVPSLLSVFGL